MTLTGENLIARRNPTWTDPGSNPGLRGWRLAANRLSHGTASHARLLRLAVATHTVVIVTSDDMAD
jgi:hypothetical protein